MRNGQVWEEGIPVGLNPLVIKYLGAFLMIGQESIDPL